VFLWDWNRPQVRHLNYTAQYLVRASETFNHSAPNEGLQFTRSYLQIQLSVPMENYSFFSNQYAFSAIIYRNCRRQKNCQFTSSQWKCWHCLEWVSFPPTQTARPISPVQRTIFNLSVPVSSLA